MPETTIDTEPKELIQEIESFLVRFDKTESKLVNKNEKFEIELNRDGIEIGLPEPFFLHSLDLSAEKFDPEKLQATAEDVFSGSIRTFSIDSKDPVNGIYSIQIGTIIRGLKLKYRKSWFESAGLRVNAIKFYGIPLKNIEENLIPLVNIKNYKESTEKEIAAERGALQAKQTAAATEVAAAKQTVETLTTQLTDIQAKKVTADTQLATAVKALADKNAELAAINVEVAASSDKLKNATDGLEKSESENRRLVGENEKLKEDILGKQAELRALKKESAMYSNEYASFSKQGNKYMWAYGLLSLIPLGLLSVTAYKIFENAIRFDEMKQLLAENEVSEIFMLRLPFVLVASGLITASYYILKLLILKMIDIQTEKMSLSKLSIFAQDAVNLSSVDYNLTPEQIFEANIYLRMDLLKNYMTNEIDRNYKYSLRDKQLLDNVVKDSIGKKIFEFFFRKKPAPVPPKGP